MEEEATLATEAETAAGAVEEEDETTGGSAGALTDSALHLACSRAALLAARTALRAAP